MTSIIIVGWTTCDFSSFSTEFQPYKDDGKGDNVRLCAVELRFWLKRKPLYQQAGPTGAPINWHNCLKYLASNTYFKIPRI